MDVYFDDFVDDFSHPYLSICADPLDVVSLQVYLSFKRNKKHLVFATPHGIIEVTVLATG